MKRYALLLLVLPLATFSSALQAADFNRVVSLNLESPVVSRDDILPAGLPDMLIFRATFSPIDLSVSDFANFTFNFVGNDGLPRMLKVIDTDVAGSELINFGPRVTSATDATAGFFGDLTYTNVTGQLLLGRSTVTQDVSLGANSPNIVEIFGTRGNHTNSDFGFGGLSFRLGVRSLAGTTSVHLDELWMEVDASDLAGGQGALAVVAVPEVGTLTLLMAGLSALVLRIRPRRV